MDHEILAAICGAIAGGLISLAYDGVKSWKNRRHVSVSASIVVRWKPGEPREYQVLNMTITNDGGCPVHIVQYGIWKPCNLTTQDREKKRELRKFNRSLLGFRGWFRMVALYQQGLFTYDDVVALAPGQPHFLKDFKLSPSLSAKLGDRVIVFAEDSLGKRWTTKVHVTKLDRESLNSATPVGHLSGAVAS